MSSKTIALDTRVYDRLAAAKRDGESFSRVIDRLLTELEAAHTGADITRGLDAFSPLSAEDAQVFLTGVAENRDSETWDGDDIR